MHNHCIHVYVLFSTHSISTNYTYPIFFLYYSFFILFCFIPSFPFSFIFIQTFSLSFCIRFQPGLFFFLLYLFSSISFSLSSYIYFPPFPFLCPLSYNSFAIFLLCLILCTNLSSFLPSYFSLLFY